MKDAGQNCQQGIKKSLTVMAGKTQIFYRKLDYADMLKKGKIKERLHGKYHLILTIYEQGGGFR
jgi:hypothetical protein